MAIHHVVSETMTTARRATPLPSAIIPFILNNLDGFDVLLEDGERIVITPKEGALVSPSSQKYIKRTILERSPLREGGSPRLRFTYHPTNTQHTPEEARRFGLSAPRLAIYTLIYTAGETGADYKLLREKSKLTHGSVQQVLHWLRKQKLITAKPKTLS
jgi:hypothetical protein